MNYRRLGHSGLKVSEICLGAWINFGGRIDDEQTFSVLNAAIEEGINFFDTADAYAAGKAEEVMGRWMKGQDRRTLVVATKGWGRMWDGPNGQGASRKHLMDACHDSLRRLQTDYIDLYQIHAPDYETPLEETMRTLDDLVRPAIAANIYGLQIVASNIEDLANNKTRFFVVATESQAPPPTGRDKTSLTFLVPHKPGALVEVLSVFQRHGVNLSMIQSRPSRQQTWEYRFFADLQAHHDDPLLQSALTELQDHTVSYKILGSYPEAS